jgi:ATP-dependent helicase HepA
MTPKSPTHTLQPGDKVLHPYNRELGPGLVQEVSGNRMTIEFPNHGSTLQFAVAGHPLVPLTLRPGADPERWLEDFQENIVERLARLDVEAFEAFRNRLDALHLMKLRESTGLGSFLGGRIELFPHQLHVARVATAQLPVRWLLADEVGLGKTVEACLILNHLVRTAELERVLVVAPRALVVQWLGELYRKFHQVFVLVDDDRRQDVRREQGPGFNPFDVYDRAVVALEDLVEDASLARLAVSSQPDLVVVDEAHRLRRREGTAGSPEYRTIAPLCETTEHLLLLSATPLEADAHGFFRLMQLLRPEEFDSWDAFRRNLDDGTPLYPCTSATRRIDIGGLPPREPFPVDLPPFPAREAKELEAMSAKGGTPVQEAARLERLARALAEPLGREDPRIQWLGREAKKWDKRGEKSLIFVGERESLIFLKKELEYWTSRRIAVFHEDLSPAQRDLEVARFAESDGPNFLIATESGGEGRNFQFAKRLVMFDLPWDPLLVEQRIGRLDRINRRIPVEIVYFRPAEGFGAQVCRLYEALGIFRDPLGGLDRALSHVVEAIRDALATSGGNLDIDGIVQETHEARERVVRSVYHDLHRSAYRTELAPGILELVPEDLEHRTASVVLEACRQFGFEIEPKPGVACWYLEFGGQATVETLHAVPPGSRWLGTFDREEAVHRESLDFLATGHPLVEGVLAELRDGTRGQLALIEVPGDPPGTGVLMVAKDGPDFELFACDLDGQPRPAWVAAVQNPRTKLREIPAAVWGEPRWADRVRGLLSRLEIDGDLVAVAGVRFTA